MVLSSASLCCLLLLGVVCGLTTASPAPYGEPVLNAIDQAEVALPRYESDKTQATIQLNCCGCNCYGDAAINSLPNYLPYCVYCFVCPPCNQYITHY